LKLTVFSWWWLRMDFINQVQIIKVGSPSGENPDHAKRSVYDRSGSWSPTFLKTAKISATTQDGVFVFILSVPLWSRICKKNC
jgi:hypothetical protein